MRGDRSESFWIFLPIETLETEGEVSSLSIVNGIPKRREKTEELEITEP